MSRNGTGSYSLPAGNPVTTGTNIRSTWANNTLSDIATALTGSVAKDGQTTMTGNLPMGGFKVTGLSAGTTAGDSARFEQLPSATNLLPVAFGGTGASTAGAALTALGAAASGANTDITSLASPALASATATTQTAGDNSTKVATTAWVQSEGSKFGIQILPISASVAASALTISASALSLDFRSTTLGNGTVTRVSGTPASLVVPSTATLGTISATQSRLVVLALNNAGTIELAVVNIAGGNDLTETGLISSTAISAAATANNVAYSNTARTSVAYRVIGYVESTQATAGTWATAPSTIQGYGGQALAAMSSLGYGQTWQNVLASRSSGTTFFNTTGKPIMVAITGGSGGSSIIFAINGTTVVTQTSSGLATGTPAVVIVVPAGASYTVTSVSPAAWFELR
jgi:hypothetical protein